eukprot:CAMPEP_0177200164 /NCGR_PEP_ID=MMETSP0367-20130122/26074_1 /TAXON_ID=447022 ORGANISM="Scrippsiella hangoei-like, Strain SHHI-4" /NCGR_SAMPLE_ID=MMETSP0367 /ASSEMBLY_ACC=CAM_ASM_000362 /LENGTH=49 /DNA_ID=CAMNT_0018648587 /DNA_START=32 /DNA_END=181 /DNA_ORIENTATION=+
MRMAFCMFTLPRKLCQMGLLNDREQYARMFSAHTSEMNATVRASMSFES